MKTIRINNGLLISLNLFIFSSPAFTLESSVPRGDSGSSPALRIFEGSVMSRELTEGFIMGALLGTDLYFKTQRAWFSEPWLSTEFESDSNSTVSADIVSMRKGYLLAMVPNFLIFLLPNELGFYNHIGYRHAKGFTEAIYIVTPFFTDLAKLSFGKKRPNYPALTADGNEPHQARKSFWSLHAATAFSISTYSSLYLMQHYGGSWGDHLVWKIPIIVGLFATSTLISASREYNQDHDDLDLAVGSAFGSTVSLFIYATHEGWIFNLYKPTANSRIILEPGGGRYAWNF